VYYSLAIDGDDREKAAWSRFVQSEFSSYEQFWQKHVIPLTNRPTNIHFKDEATLAAEGKSQEDIAIAQLHYTVLKHLLSADAQRNGQKVDEFVLLMGLSALYAAQDVAFELLQRYTNPGKYDPWLEKRTKNGPLSGQEAQSDWKKANGYPLQDVRDYRNKLMHGRTPPAIMDASGLKLPAITTVDKYGDWRLVTDPANASKIPMADFEYVASILWYAWWQTLDYFENNWRKYLLS